MGTALQDEVAPSVPTSIAGAGHRIWPAILLPLAHPELAARLPTLPASEWVWLAAEASAHNLGPLLYATLHVHDLLSACPATLQTQLRTQYKHAALVAMQREGELRRVLAVLADSRICPVVFKGAYLAHAVYPSPGCRPMGDSDLWVTHDEMPAAVAALEGLGYSLHEKADRPHA